MPTIIKHENFIDLGPVTFSEACRLTGASHFSITTPKARCRTTGSWFFSPWKNVTIENYKNSWGADRDLRDDLIVAPNGTFKFPSRILQIDTIKNFLTTNGFDVELEERNDKLYLHFSAKEEATALYIDKFFHTWGASMQIAKFLDQKQFASVFSNEKLEETNVQVVNSRLGM